MRACRARINTGGGREGTAKPSPTPAMPAAGTWARKARRALTRRSGGFHGGRCSRRSGGLPNFAEDCSRRPSRRRRSSPNRMRGGSGTRSAGNAPYPRGGDHATTAQGARAEGERPSCTRTTTTRRRPNAMSDLRKGGAAAEIPKTPRRSSQAGMARDSSEGGSEVIRPGTGEPVGLVLACWPTSCIARRKPARPGSCGNSQRRHARPGDMRHGMSEPRSWPRSSAGSGRALAYARRRAAMGLKSGHRLSGLHDDRRNERHVTWISSPRKTFPIGVNFT